jgi:hypothetical protein
VSPALNATLRPVVEPLVALAGIVQVSVVSAPFSRRVIVLLAAIAVA